MIILNVTTCERELGFLLVDTFMTNFNPNENGHLETSGIFTSIFCVKAQSVFVDY